MDCCSCGCTNIDGSKSDDVGVGVVMASCTAVAVEYGIPYCDCWTGPGPGIDPAGGKCGDIDAQSPDTAGKDSGEGVSFGGLLAGDLMTPPFVPPKAERS